MISFSSGFTAASSGVGLMKRQRKSIPQHSTVIPPAAPTSNWIIPTNFWIINSEEFRSYLHSGKHSGNGASWLVSFGTKLQQTPLIWISCLQCTRGRRKSTGRAFSYFFFCLVMTTPPHLISSSPLSAGIYLNLSFSVATGQHLNKARGN